MPLYLTCGRRYSGNVLRTAALAIVLSTLVASCAAGPEPRRFSLRGQVLAVQPDRQVVTVKHEDIRGFMDAMTMPFKVRDRRLLDPLRPGDLITATLVVLGDESYLEGIERVGRADLPPPTAVAPPTPALLQPGEPVPDVTLTDQDGRPLALSSLAGSTVVLTFIYTRCPLPDYCPLMDRNFEAIQKAIAAGTARGVRLLSITFDPSFDTLAVLKAHAAAVGADPAIWSFLTGDAAVIEQFGARLGLEVMRDPSNPGDITHNLRTAIIDRRGTLKKIFDGNDWTPRDVLAELAALPGS